ncbi:MAG: hypothetical protein JO295_01135 [Verrucomicrobia bacterium]|nr:hypothetical protein [Verrucomicrobiota bacterium]
MSIKLILLTGLATLGCGAFTQVKAAQPAASPLAVGNGSVYVMEEIIIVRHHRRGHWVRVYRHGYFVRRVWVRD